MPTFEQILNVIKLGIRPTEELYLHSQTEDIQNKFIEKLFKNKIHHCHHCKERWNVTKGYVDSDDKFECQKWECTRKDTQILVRLVSNESIMDPALELTRIML